MLAHSILDAECDGIASGKHNLITSSWPTDHRGPLLLMGVGSIRSTFSDSHRAKARLIVQITAVRPMEPGDQGHAYFEYMPHRYVWAIGSVEVLPEPWAVVSGCGRLMYEVPEAIARANSPAPIATPAPVATPQPAVVPPDTRRVATGFPDVQAPSAKKSRKAAAVAGNEMGGLFG